MPGDKKQKGVSELEGCDLCKREPRTGISTLNLVALL